MGCANLFFTTVIIFSAALITYIILVSVNTSLNPDFPSPSIFGRKFRNSNDPVIKMPVERESEKKRLFHTAVTSSDSVYNTWQCRIMYYWFMKFKDGPGSEMGGFTRILHSRNPDRFVDEIPIEDSPSPLRSQSFLLLHMKVKLG